jgi:hypothetical protein
MSGNCFMLNSFQAIRWIHIVYEYELQTANLQSSTIKIYYGHNATSWKQRNVK